MDSIIGLLTTRSTHTEVNLKSKPYGETLDKINDFLLQKKGSFIDDSQQCFVIARKVSAKHLQQLFNYYEINISIIGATELNGKQDNSSKIETWEKISSEYRINFGKYKGYSVSELPNYYLEFLSNNCSEIKVTKLCENELKNRNTIKIF